MRTVAGKITMRCFDFYCERNVFFLEKPSRQVISCSQHPPLVLCVLGVQPINLKMRSIYNTFHDTISIQSEAFKTKVKYSREQFKREIFLLTVNSVTQFLPHAAQDNPFCDHANNCENNTLATGKS